MRFSIRIVCRLTTLLVLFIGIGAAAQPSPPGISDAALAQIAAIMEEKASRTPHERKLDSNLLYGMRAVAAGKATRASTAAPYVAEFLTANVAADGMVAVTIRATVSDDLLAALKLSGAQDVSSFPEYDTVSARFPIAQLLSIASRADVRFVGLTEKPMSKRPILASDVIKAQLSPAPRDRQKVGSVTSEGVIAHKANLAFSSGISGAGAFVCVISDGINSYAARQATGDLPALVALGGQTGSGDEGTAMLEIIHDMAPGAALGFAPQGFTEASVVNSINGLRAGGCSIIVDDVGFKNESAFQDGPVSGAIKTFTDGGGLYFSSSGNSGNRTRANSGTWEGDFFYSGFNATLNGNIVRLHDFGGAIGNTLSDGPLGSARAITLKWSDPLTLSANDYDLFLFDAAGTLIRSSTNVQNGNQDPLERIDCNPSTCPIGSQIVIGLYSGFTRALRIDTHQGFLNYATPGSTFGHSAAASAITVAAVDVATAGGGAFLGGAANPVENFSSDGPRKLFYNPNGTAITPGNVLFNTGGGTTLQKVDIAAANRVRTSTPGYITFPGTSAAAPHAAAIAALAWSAKPSATAAQVKAALFASALDIEASGWDRDSGHGIVMADTAVKAMLTPLTVTKSFSPPRIAPGGTSTLTFTATNPNAVALQGIAFTDTYPALVTNAAMPNVTAAGAGCTGSAVAAGNGGAIAFSAGTVPAGITCTYTVQVTASTSGIYVDGSGTLTTPIALNTPGVSATLTVVSVTLSPTTLSGGTRATAYSQSISASGGVAPYAFAVSAGTLPGGLTLTSSGTLSGTPTAAGSFNFTVTATDSTAAGLGGPFSGSRAYSVNIVNPSAIVTVNSSVNPAAVGQTSVYTATLIGNGPTPTGTVTFNDAAVAMCSAVVVATGQATCTYDGLPAGTRSITAAYSGDGSYTASTSPIHSQSVVAATSRVLTVNKSGTGGGTVTSNPAGINCGVDCAEPYASATTVTLTATPAAPGSSFVGWLGACVGTLPCTVTVDAATSLTATFAPANVVVSLDVDGDTFFNALTDGLLVVRYMNNLTAAGLTTAATATGATRSIPQDVLNYLDNIRPSLDIDGNGQLDALADGVIVVRYLLGLKGDAIFAGAVGAGARRTQADMLTQLNLLAPGIP